MAMPRKQDPKKTCEHCGIPLVRKASKGRLEDRTVFLRRRYCSLTCANSRRRPLTKHGYSFRARKHLKEACEACQQTTSLQAHHIDQIISNNSQQNIQTLCKTCHDFWHSTAKRRGWNIAGRMPTLVVTGNQG